MLVALSVALVAALVGGATMAWFTDSAETGEVEFTAGTVNIEAGAAGVVVPAPDAEMGAAWQVENVFPETVESYDQGTLPNGGAVQTARSNPSTVLTLNEGQDASNFFSLGYYMEPNNGPGNSETKEHWKERGGEIVVRFADPVWVSEGRLVVVVEDTWGSWPEEKAEVYVSKDGADWVLAGHALNGTGTPQSYSYITVPEAVSWFQFVKVVDVTNPYDFGDSRWSTNDNDAFDLNTIMVQHWECVNWNPGDCDELIYLVSNVGTKRSLVRAAFSGHWLEFNEESGEWVDSDLPIDVVSTEPCENSGWTLEGEHFYYNTVLASGETAELCLRICLKGEETGNEYQGMRFVVTGGFEAIQASNGASQDVWGWSLNLNN